MANIWYCKVGTSDNVPAGGDWPMRQAVEEAFREVTGGDPEFTFSGWGAELTEVQQAVVENREPVYEKTETALIETFKEFHAAFVEANRRSYMDVETVRRLHAAAGRAAAVLRHV